MKSTDSSDLVAEGGLEILQDLWTRESGVDTSENDLDRSGRRCDPSYSDGAEGRTGLREVRLEALDITWSDLVF